MYKDRRHKYFYYALIAVVALVMTEVVFPDLVWWQRWAFVYPAIGLVGYYFARFMGWWVEPPTNEWDEMTPEQREAARFERR